MGQKAGRNPSLTQPGPAHPRFTRRVCLPPQAWVLGAWGERGTQKALTRELRLKG